MAKISFTVGAKQEPSDLTSTTANPLNKYSRLKDGYFANDSVASDDIAVISSNTSKAPLALPTSTESPALQSESSTSRAASTLDRWDRSQHPRSNFSLSKQYSTPGTSRGIPLETPSRRRDATEETTRVESMGGKSGPEGPGRVRGREDVIKMGRGGKIAADPRKEEEAVLRMGVTVRPGNEMGRDDVMERGGIETAHSAGRDIGPDEMNLPPDVLTVTAHAHDLLPVIPNLPSGPAHHPVVRPPNHPPPGLTNHQTPPHSLHLRKIHPKVPSLVTTHHYPRPTAPPRPPPPTPKSPRPHHQKWTLTKTPTRRQRKCAE
ncbi:hypothetical protein XANCAGTX0491_007793 [Xanthoria calcicola]